LVVLAAAANVDVVIGDINANAGDVVVAVVCTWFDRCCGMDVDESVQPTRVDTMGIQVQARDGGGVGLGYQSHQRAIIEIKKSKRS
jgi:hypothetical protein